MMDDFRKQIRVTAMLGVAGLFGPAASGWAAELEQIAILGGGATVVSNDQGQSSFSVHSDFALFQNQLIYFGADARPFSQPLPTPSSPSNDQLRALAWPPGTTELSSSRPRFRVFGDHLVVEASHTASGTLQRHAHRLDLEASGSTVVQDWTNQEFNAVLHDGWRYTVRTIASSSESYSGCAWPTDVDRLERRENTTGFPAFQTVSFGSVNSGSCEEIMSMQSTPLGLLINTRYALANRYSGGHDRKLFLITSFSDGPEGLRGNGRTLQMGHWPHYDGSNQFVVGNSIYFEKQIASYNPNGIGNPSEPDQPVFRGHLFDTTTGTTTELDDHFTRVSYNRVTTWLTVNDAVYWVANDANGVATLYRMRSDTGLREALSLSVNGPASELQLVGVHAGRLLLIADTGNGLDLHYVASDGETVIPLYLDSGIMASAKNFKSEGSNVVFVAEDPATNVWSFYRLLESDSGNSTEATVSGEVELQLTFNGQSAPARPGIKYDKRAEVQVACEIVNNTNVTLTDVDFRLKWQRYRGKNRMTRAALDGCSGLTVSPGARASCGYAWSARRGSRLHQCAVIATRSDTGARSKRSVAGYVKGRR